MSADRAHRVVVTGLGVIAPNAHGPAAFVEALKKGTSGIRFLPELKESGFACQVAGVPHGVEALKGQYLTEEQLRAMNVNMIYAAIAAIDAWTDAGLARPAEDSDEVDWDSGAVLGTGLAGVETIAEKVLPRVAEGKVGRLGSMMAEQMMASGTSARVGGLLALGNQVTTNSSACTTGTEAIVDAWQRVREGRAKRMLAGGSEGSSKYTWAPFDAMKVLNRSRNEAPEQASRPLSASAAGFVPGSGAGVLMLESLESAVERGARIYAEVLGAAVNAGGHRMGGSMTAPNPEGVRRCIAGAMATARVRSEEIDLINGHLTATFADAREVQGWSAALGLAPRQMPLIQATKSLIGHALGAAGGIESVATVLQVHHGFVHGSVNCEDLHPALEPFAERIARRTLETHPLRIAAKASFGFGDVNGCVIFGRLQ